MSISLLLYFETNDFRHFDLYKTNFCSFFFAFVIRLNNVTDDRKKKTTVVFLDFFFDLRVFDSKLDYFHFTHV